MSSKGKQTSDFKSAYRAETKSEIKFLFHNNMWKLLCTAEIKDFLYYHQHLKCF